MELSSTHRKLLLWALWAITVFIGLEMVLVCGQWMTTDKLPTPPGSCQADNEGQWSIGIYKGPSLQELQPIERWTPPANSGAAWPVSNPVMTCAHVNDSPSGFVADPFLYIKDSKTWYMFYETKTIKTNQGDIGAAVSTDLGLTWKHLGVVLDEPWHLSYPFVFEDKGKMYMIPEGSNSGSLRLYTTSTFPTGWKLDKVLIDQPLIDASLVPPSLGWPGSKGHWYMFASNRKQPTSRNCRELEIWMAPSLHGPWTPHPQNPVRAGIQGSRMAGRPVVADKKLHRFGQDCTYTYGHHVRSFLVLALNQTHFEEREQALGFDPAGGRSGGSTWNSVRHHHIDAQPLPSGGYIALMDGDKYVSDYQTWDMWHRLSYTIPISLVIAITLGACWTVVFRPAGSPAAGREASCCMACLPVVIRAKLFPHASYTLADGGPLFEGDSAKRNKSAAGKGKPDPVWLRPLTWLCGFNLWHLVGLVVVGVLLTWLTWLYIWHIGRGQLLTFLVWYIKACGGSNQPHTLSGQHSKFTVLVMSYEARLITLKTFVHHYGRCASVGEIVVVWNKGTPPDPALDLPSQVPVRVRAEKANSMNNRFQPDPLITTRAVLMLDDDLIMPCADIERGFARWRENPDQIVGYFPRVLQGDPPQYQCTQCERHTYHEGVYNVILAGASFLDQHRVFELYSADANKEGRAYVDRVFNCDDLLLNYLMAANSQGHQYVNWVRPTKRFDVGKLTSARLSTGNFGPVRHNCTRDFAAIFGNPLKGRMYWLDFESMGKPMCPTGIGCMFV